MFNRNFLFVLSMVLLTLSCSTKKDSLKDFVRIDPLPSPALENSGEPYLYTDHGTTRLSWLQTIDTVTLLKLSTLESGKWSDPVTVASGTTWFVNWADYPTIAANGNNLIAHYLDESGPGKYSYDAKYMVSNDSRSWSAPILLNDDGKDAEHGFVSMVPYKDGFFASWLDGRNAAMEGSDHSHGHHGSMTLRAALIDKNGKKSDEWLLDERVCDCCQTSAVITNNGPVVVYRDRSGDEVRDMSVVRWDGKKWSKPVNIYNDNWQINGCPVNGPRMSAMGDDLAIVWFSAPADSTEVKVTFSDDNGASFSKPVLINRSQTLGRVDIEMMDDRSAAVSWIENDSIRIIKVDRDGNRSTPVAVAKIASGRSSGFPQMTRNGGQLIFAWTDQETNSIRCASLEL